MTAEILKALYEADGAFVSGEELGRRFGVSRASIANRVAELKRKGFRIESNTRCGHRLASLGDVLSEESLALFTSVPVAYYDVLNSTFEPAKSGDGELLVVAGRQNGGRGRRNRAFDSGEGGAYFTYRCEPRLPPARANLLTLAAGIAVARTVRSYGADAMLKYPNDGWIGGKKFCGILTECRMNEDEITAASVGIGINVSNRLDSSISAIAVSLVDRANRPIVRAKLIAEVVAEFRRLLSAPDAIVAAYRPFDALLNEPIDLIDGTGRTPAIARGVNADGYLLAEVSGELRTITVGEVSIRRRGQTDAINQTE